MVLVYILFKKPGRVNTIFFDFDNNLKLSYYFSFVLSLFIELVEYVVFSLIVKNGFNNSSDYCTSVFKKEKRKIQNRRGGFILHYCFIDEFFSYTRMTMSTFYELYSLLETNLTKQTTIMQSPIGPKERLCIALR
ncbi:hypothetical protein QTP88_026299 [Uroleucon formosanum]